MQEKSIKDYKNSNIFKICLFFQALFLNKIITHAEIADSMIQNQPKMRYPLDFCLIHSINDFRLPQCQESDRQDDEFIPLLSTPIIATKSSSDVEINTESALISKLIISEAIEKARIHIHPRLLSAIKKSWLPLIEKEILQIKKLLPYTVHPKLLLKILKDSTFSIELVSYNDWELTNNGKFLGTNARYLPLANKILIGSDTYTSDRERLHILRNELHHAIVRHVNFQRQSSPKKKLPPPMESIKIIRPFLKNFWQIDSKLRSKHDKALEKGFDRVKNFEELLIQSKSSLDDQDKKKLHKWLSGIKHYESQVHIETIPKNIFYMFGEKIMTKKDGVKMITLPDQKTSGYVLDEYWDSDSLIIKYTFSNPNINTVEDKAKAFIKDIEMTKKMLTGYHHEKAKELESTECSSFIQEIEITTLKMFFPEWCQYFSDYHKVENYCQVMDDRHDFSSFRPKH